MKEKVQAPELRFDGFTDDWELRKLTNITSSYSGLTYSPTDIQDTGTFVLRSSNVKNDQLIDADNVYVNPDIVNSINVKVGDVIIVVRNGSRALIGKHAIVNEEMPDTVIGAFMSAFRGENGNYINALLSTDNFQKEVHKSLGATINQITGKDFSMMIFPTPKFGEQQKIGAFFKQLDYTIALHQRKLDLLKEQKKGYLQKMFPKNGAKVPELRFAGFADDWEERKLSSGLREYTDRVIVEDDKEYYQISVRNNFGGITLRGSKMGNKIGRKRQAKINLTKYPQTLIFTRQTVEQGGIGWVDKYCDGAIVTENMPTISLDTSVFSKYFLTNLFQTRIFYKNAILDNIEGGSAQIAIHESKFLSSTLLFPNLDEQEKIGQFFKQLDDTIDLHQRKLDLLKEQKKGYLQKMFPKNGAKVPELRFAGFADDWEERKLGDVVGEIQSGNRLPKDSLTSGNIPYVVAQTKNEGVFKTISKKTLDYNGNPMKLFPGNSISFSIDNPEAMFYRSTEFYTSNIMRVIHADYLSHQQYLFILENMKSFTRGYDWSRKFSGPVVSNLEYLQPNEQEQCKIGSFILAFDNIITLHQRKLDLLKEQKKGLLQKMFV